MPLNTIPEAIAAIANGELIVVVDDDDRENEGDLIMAASKAMPEQIAFMVRHTSGILCAPMQVERAERLNLTPMVANNLDPLRTAFTVTVDYRVGMTTGISAEERTNTLRALANDNCVANDFLRPGHVFPLISRPGGVLSRSGHTEAATDLAQLAGLQGVGVLAEVVNDDGTVKRLPELLAFAEEHDLKIISIEDLIEYRVRTESFVSRVATFNNKVPVSNAVAHIYETPFDPMQHMVIVIGDIGDGQDIPCRIHHEQSIEDLLSSTSESWVGSALSRFEQRGRGILVYLRDAKITSFSNGNNKDQDNDNDNEGAEVHDSAQQRMKRWRDIGLGAQILRDLGVSSIRLIAKGQRHYVGLSGFGIDITDTEIVE